MGEIKVTQKFPDLQYQVQHCIRLIMTEIQEPYMCRVVRKQNYCLCENKGTDQLSSYCTADLRLCFRYTDSTIQLFPKSQISSF